MSKFSELEKLVFVTTEDRVISKETQVKYAERLINATIQTIQSGHLPMIVKTKEVFAQISTFLAKLD